MNLPQWTAELSLYQPGTHYRTNVRTNLVGSSPRTITTAQSGTGTQGDTGTGIDTGTGTFGDGPNQDQLPPGYTCQATSDYVQTCYHCWNTPLHGRLCTCYDCSNGECTPGYACTMP